MNLLTNEVADNVQGISSVHEMLGEGHAVFGWRLTMVADARSVTLEGLIIFCTLSLIKLYENSLSLVRTYVVHVFAIFAAVQLNTF